MTNCIPNSRFKFKIGKNCVGFIRFADLDWNRIDYLKHLLEKSSKLIEHSALIEELSFSTPTASYTKLHFLQLSQI